MARLQRCDDLGAWHHVLGRGIARRTMFESARDIRFFLSLVAREVRRGRLEVHSYCVMSTHFHLLICSLRGELSSAMQWVLNQYVRWFNRTRERDGPLMRSRFVSLRADSITYRRHLVRYLDFNAVHAGLVTAPPLYPHCSARSFSTGRIPLWLSREWIEAQIERKHPGAPLDISTYARVFGRPLQEGVVRWIERRVADGSTRADPIDELVAGAPEQVREWMRRKALLADGTEVGEVLCDAADLSLLVQQESLRIGEWTIQFSRRGQSGWDLVHSGLLRSLCGSSLREIAMIQGTTIHVVRGALDKHRELMVSDLGYASRAGEVAALVMQEMHGTA